MAIRPNYGIPYTLPRIPLHIRETGTSINNPIIQPPIRTM